MPDTSGLPTPDEPTAPAVDSAASAPTDIQDDLTSSYATVKAASLTRDDSTATDTVSSLQSTRPWSSQLDKTNPWTTWSAAEKNGGAPTRRAWEQPSSVTPEALSAPQSTEGSGTVAAPIAGVSTFMRDRPRDDAPTISRLIGSDQDTLPSIRPSERLAEQAKPRPSVQEVELALRGEEIVPTRATDLNPSPRATQLPDEPNPWDTARPVTTSAASSHPREESGGSDVVVDERPKFTSVRSSIAKWGENKETSSTGTISAASATPHRARPTSMHFGGAADNSLPPVTEQAADGGDDWNLVRAGTVSGVAARWRAESTSSSRARADSAPRTRPSTMYGAVPACDPAPAPAHMLAPVHVSKPEVGNNVVIDSKMAEPIAALEALVQGNYDQAGEVVERVEATGVTLSCEYEGQSLAESLC